MRRHLPMSAIEVALWVAGVALLAFWSVAFIGGEVERGQAIAQFVQTRAAADLRLEDAVRPSEDLGPDPVPSASAAIDHTQPPAAVPAAAVAVNAATLPIALLRIPRVALEVPVFADTSERNLNRGAGWIEGTALPGEIGNIGIAAHRDRYFRVLKDVVLGDVLELESLSQRRTYRVTSLSIVKPDDVSSLRATETSALTLVTCYPFYYVGHAPKRYIVRAVITSETAQARDWSAPTAQR